MEEVKLKNRKFIFYITTILLFILVLSKGFSSFAVTNNIYNCTSAPPENSAEHKVVYLTFDDGPSDVITDRVLDILKENNVKATFFLIGNQINGLEDAVKRIHSEGHSIGLHTYTHKNKRIYSNKDTFIKEMLDCRDEINNVVGVSPNIIRFPGGSRKHINKAYLEKLHSYNFKIYDWNVETSDGINPKISPDKQYRKAVKESKDLSDIILLMHCDYMHKNTCKALPKIIKYYKENGYEFKPITDNTPELIFE